jgi:hypothetical protein
MNLLRSLTAGFLLLVFGGLAALAADDATLKAAVASQLDELNRALLAEDYGKIADLTLPRLRDMAGGREAVIAQIQSDMQLVKQKGFILKEIINEAPGDVVVDGDRLMVVIPHTVKMTTPQWRISKRSFVIGVSGDKGQTWTFINGDVDPARLKGTLPDLPETLKLPERQKAVREEIHRDPPNPE